MDGDKQMAHPVTFSKEFLIMTSIWCRQDSTEEGAFRFECLLHAKVAQCRYTVAEKIGLEEELGGLGCTQVHDLVLLVDPV